MKPSSMKWVVLSPHPDDAVFSVWHLLSSSLEVQVITVFAGVPANGYVSPLDSWSGATISAQKMRKRRADDIAALSSIGRGVIHTDFLDVQYRIDGLPDLLAEIRKDPDHFMHIVSMHDEIRMKGEDLLSGISPLLGEAAVGIYAPVGIGGHPDHADVGYLGRKLLEQGRRVRFYADMPYLVRQGRPSWLSGVVNAQADEIADRGFARLGMRASDMHRHVISLDPAEAARKITTARMYETEFEPANRDFGGILTDLETMRTEVFWSPSD